MNILIADSGSSKTDWRYISRDSEINELRTTGLNPGFLSTDEIFSVLKGVKQELEIERVDEVHFYTAGTSNQLKKEILNKELTKVFNTDINLYSDLLGTCRALFGKNDGIGCILGTGSNAGYYDGNKIVAAAPSLGWILGDEGSGSHIGKMILGDYFFEHMPNSIYRLLQEELKFDRKQLLEIISSGKNPQKHISYVTEIAGRTRNEYIYKVVAESFGKFFDKQLAYVIQAKELPIGFTGSVAYEFSEILRNTLELRGYLPYRIIRNPINEIVEYHCPQYD